MTTPRSKLGRLYAENVWLRTTIASLVLVVFGVLLLRWSSGVGRPWNGVIEAVGSTLVTVGGIGIIYEVWLRRSTLEEAYNVAHLSGDLAQWGIEEVRTYGSIDWTDFFLQGHGDVEVAVAYGRTWAGAHAGDAIAAATRNGGRLRLTMLDPDAPLEVLNFYALLYGTTPDRLKEKVLETIEVWRQRIQVARKEGQKVRCVVEGVHRVVPYTYYAHGPCMWLVLNPRWPGYGGEQLPAFRCKPAGQGLYEWVDKDMDRCREGRVVVQREEL